MQHVRLLTYTTILTGLVWASADQLLIETVELPVKILVTAAPNSGLVVQAAGDVPETHLVTLAGRKAAVAKLRQRETPEVTLKLGGECVSASSDGGAGADRLSNRSADSV